MGQGAAKTQPTSQKATVSSLGTTTALESDGVHVTVHVTVHVDGLRPGDVHRLRRMA